MRVLEGSWGALEGLLEDSWGLLGRLRGLLRLLEGSWRALGEALGRLLGALAPSKGFLEGLGRLLGGSWGALGWLLGRLVGPYRNMIFSRWAKIDFYKILLQKHEFS